MTDIFQPGDLDKIGQALRESLGTAIEVPKVYRIGRLLPDGTRQIDVPNPIIPGSVWIRPQGNEVGEAVEAVNTMAEAFIYGDFVEVEPYAGGLRVVRFAVENAHYRSGVVVPPQELIDISRINAGLIVPMRSDATMKCVVTSTFRTLSQTIYYQPNLQTKDFTADIPATAGQAIGVLVSIDPVTNTLYYDNSPTFSAALTLAQVFNTTLIKAISATRFTAGWVKLYNGQTAITANDILTHQEMIAKVGVVDIPEPVFPEIVTYRGKVLTFNGEVITWSAA